MKKPRLGLAAASASAGTVSLMKPLGPNFVYNGFGGSERADPFAKDFDEEEESVLKNNNVPISSSSTATTKTISINNRLKSGGLRNFKLNK